MNGREYNWPESPTVVICCDGSEPAYMELALAKGLMPNLQRIIVKGADLRGQSVIPSFTNPNNLSIITGQPPKVHGISGNYFFDRASKKEVISTTDFIQHKYAPDTSGANAFYVMMDRYLGQLDAAGAVIVLTADHGMKDKHIGGEPDVVYLQDLLDEWVGAEKTRVILPITDPYVVHHGALGSFATVYLDEGLDAADLIKRIKALPLIQIVVDGKEGCMMFDLPEDRLGDLIVVSRDTKVIGTSRSRHDLAALKEPLRSHGGITEQTIPMIVNRKVVDVPKPLHNYDAFAVGLNHVAAAAEAAA